MNIFLKLKKYAPTTLYGCYLYFAGNCVIFQWLLIIVTWPLWWGDIHYPVVPFFAGLLNISLIVDRSLLVLLCLALATMFWALFWYAKIKKKPLKTNPHKLNARQKNRENKKTPKTFSVKSITTLPFTPWQVLLGSQVFVLLCLVGLVLLSQQRLQPWVWQSMLLALFFIAIGLGFKQEKVVVELFLKGAFWLTTSIYFFSAVSKFDLNFIYSIGKQWVILLNQFVPISIATTAVLGKQLSDFIMPAMFPLYELAVAVLMLIPTTRKTGLLLSMMMHGMLLLLLGPLGANQMPGVLIWNLYFICQNLVLYHAVKYMTPPVPVESKTHYPEQVSKLQVKKNYALYVLFGCCMLPTLNIFGVYDEWLAWGVYAERHAKVEIHVNQNGVKRLSRLMPELTSSGTPSSAMKYIGINQYALQETYAPVPTMISYRLAVAKFIVSKLNNNASWKIRVVKPYPRLWHRGTRLKSWQKKSYISLITRKEDLNKFIMKSTLFNTLSRKLGK